MRLQDLETEAHHMLRAVVRSIDKRLNLQVQDGPTPQDPLLVLALNQGNLQTSLEVSVEELRRALENSRNRAALRQRIKRANERLWHPAKPAPLSSTKAIRPGSESFVHLRSHGGRR